MSQGLIGTAESEGWLACVKSSGGWVVWVGVRGWGQKKGSLVSPLVGCGPRRPELLKQILLRSVFVGDGIPLWVEENRPP